MARGLPRPLCNKRLQIDGHRLTPDFLWEEIRVVVETDGEQVSEFVAEGKVELGLIVTPNIMSVPGAELVGSLPAEINSIVMFTAGVSAQSPNQKAANDLIKLLTSPEAKPVIKAKGNDPA